VRFGTHDIGKIEAVDSKVYIEEGGLQIGKVGRSFWAVRNGLKNANAYGEERKRRERD